MRALLIANYNWLENLNIPEHVSYEWFTPLQVENVLKQRYDQYMITKKDKSKKKKRLKLFDVIIIDSFDGMGDMSIFFKYVQPYTCLYNQNEMPITLEQKEVIARLMGQPYDFTNRQVFMDYISIAFAKVEHGLTLDIKNTVIHPNFSGKFFYEGNAYVTAEGDFGENYIELLSYQYNMRVDYSKPIEIWPEYILEDGLSICYKIRLFSLGSLYGVTKEYILYEEDLKTAFVIQSDDNMSSAAVSVFVKGKGTVKVGAMHYRQARLGAGHFLPGGQIFADKQRQEFIYYFSPGDLKPPLNVYFSGYRPAEGFEGYWMMQKMKAPFLLFGDPRLEGGAFYLGSKEYEDKLKSIILDTLKLLQFEETDLILSGLSMGTFGALYYGAKLQPSAIIVGKPLANIGDIVKNGKLVRPDDFLTSMDVLQLAQGTNNEESAQQINDRFWDNFSNRQWDDTTLAVAYMKQDDYDSQAYYQLLEYASEQNAKVFGRGWVGRHNDESFLIVNWFVRHYNRILKERFNRE